MYKAGYDENIIKSYLQGRAQKTKLFIFDSLPSTNSLAKELAADSSHKKAVAIIADAQSAGRGTRGRSFVSKRGLGLYMSILFYPKEGISPADITVFAAVKICESIEALAPIEAKIKWVNDIYVSGKKLAGILTEGKLNGKNLDYAIMGAGINTHGCTLPAEISDIATSVERECGVKIDRELLFAEIINRFINCEEEIGSKEIMKEYKRRSLILNKDVRVFQNGKAFLAKTVEILDTGALLVRDSEGNLIELGSGDVSLKLNT